MDYMCPNSKSKVALGMPDKRLLLYGKNTKENTLHSSYKQKKAKIILTPFVKVLKTTPSELSSRDSNQNMVAGEDFVLTGDKDIVDRRYIQQTKMTLP